MKRYFDNISKNDKNKILEQVIQDENFKFNTRPIHIIPPSELIMSFNKKVKTTLYKNKIIEYWDIG